MQFCLLMLAVALSLSAFSLIRDELPDLSPFLSEFLCAAKVWSVVEFFSELPGCFDSSSAVLMPSADWASRKSARRQSWFGVVAKLWNYKEIFFISKCPSSETVCITIFVISFFDVTLPFFKVSDNSSSSAVAKAHPSWTMEPLLRLSSQDIVVQTL